MGVARVRRRSELEGREGEMEWVWSLHCISSIFQGQETRSYERTSAGSPYLE